METESSYLEWLELGPFQRKALQCLVEAQGPVDATALVWPYGVSRVIPTHWFTELTWVGLAWEVEPGVYVASPSGIALDEGRPKAVAS